MIGTKHVFCQNKKMQWRLEAIGVDILVNSVCDRRKRSGKQNSAGILLFFISYAIQELMQVLYNYN